MIEEPLKVLTYRNINIPLYYDEINQEFYCFLDGQYTRFGRLNTDFEDDLKKLVDYKLDYICGFNDFPGAKLEWFFNGHLDRDIRLVYNSRVLKVYLVTSESEITASSISYIKDDCVKILQKIRSLRENKLDSECIPILGATIG